MSSALAIIASPRNNGNSDVAAKIILDSAEADDKSIINLYDLKIQPCTACYTCLFKKGCILKDDVIWVLDKIDKTDKLILISNTYFMGINGIWKVFLDRMLLLNQYKNIKGTPSVLLSISGIKGWEGLTLSSLSVIAFTMDLNVKAQMDIIATLPGEIANSQKELENMGKALCSENFTNAKQEYGVCGFCGSNSFKIKNNKTVCAICGKPYEGGDPVIKANWSEHADWLRNKKEEFIKRKRELFEIYNKFNKIKYRIKPSKDKEQK